MSATTEERNRQIVEAHRAGETLRAIGDRHGLSQERVRQIVLRADGPRRSSRRRSGKKSVKKVVGGEHVRLRIGNLAKAVLVTGQAYQDPKDALNEFVSNAADEYAESDRRGERIRVVLRRKGRYPVIAVDDSGSGLSPDRLREVARNLFESSKVGDDRTLGEKAIGLLGFQQLGARCEVVSRAEGSSETWTLLLERGSASARLSRERRRARTTAGTTVYLSQLDPEVLRMLTQRKVVEYLRRRRGAALARGDYSIEVVEGRNAEVVTPEEPDGVKLNLPARVTLWGRIEFGLYVAAEPDRSRRVAVVGRAGTTIIDDLAELEEFDHSPWTSSQVSGQVIFEALQQSAGRRAVLRDRDAFPVFRDAIAAVEPAVSRTVERLRQDVDADTADRISDTVRRIFGRVLKELADLDNPMRTPVGSDDADSGANQDSSTLVDHGAGDRPAAAADLVDGPSPSGPDPSTEPSQPTPGIDDLAPDPVPPSGTDGTSADGDGSLDGLGAAKPSGRSRHLPNLAVDPDPAQGRSRFDQDDGVVYYNDRHSDYLLVKDDEPSLLDYLATLVAKEYVVYNNPLAAATDLGEEMVRMLVRVRRHLPRKR